MNLDIETLNRWGGQFLNFAWPMLWQSSLLIAIIFVMEFAFRRKIRAAIRYTLWLILLLKLVLPPALALPTSAAWWLRTSPQPTAKPPTSSFVVTYGNQTAPGLPMTLPPVSTVRLPSPTLSGAAWTLMLSGLVGSGLFAWLLFRWQQVALKIRRASDSNEFNAVLDDCRHLAGLRSAVRLKLTEDSMSPAVCGLFRPVILLPQSLAKNLSADQLRAVLLHEAIHLRRGDVWVNCAQTLLQIVYWWHPLLWLANARIRCVREEAVDDAVMFALRDDAEIYAPTLLEVARHAFNRPLASLGLVGILESRSALRQRIERLINFDAPKKAGLTIVSILGILAFTAVALPMGQAPEKTNTPAPVLQPNNNSPIATNAVENKMEARNLVQDGKLLYEIGKFDEAEAKLKAALVLDSENAAAKYYLGLVAQSGRHSPQDIYTSPGREMIYRKLNQIHLESVSWSDGLPLSVVIYYLAEQSKLHDPDKKGISFIFNPNVAASPVAVGSGAGAVSLPDPLTGRIETSADGTVPENVDANAIKVKLAFKDASLQYVLDAVVKGADKPIKYSVEDYGVVFSPYDPAKPQLEMRVFKVDTNAFFSALRGVRNLKTDDVVMMAKEFFGHLGVDLSTPGRSIAFNDGLGLLFVKATASELDTVERVVQALNQIPPQIHIKARFIELEQNDNKALGFDWYLGNFASNTVATNGVSAPVPAANRPGAFPGKTATNVASASATDQPLIGGLRNTAPAPATITGILTDPYFRVTLHALEKRPGAETLAEPECVTSSGRQTQMRATDIMTVLTNINPLALKPPGVSTNELFLTEQVECGPVFDVVPYVLSDGYTIYLSTTASVTEFLGYDKPTGSVTVYINGKKQTVPMPLPKFRTQRMSTHLNLYDGQTVVLSGPNTSIIQTTKDKVPLLGDLPLIGGLFQSQKKNSVKKQLMVFVTASIVDPAGNRVHAGDELRQIQEKTKSYSPPQPQFPSPSR